MAEADLTARPQGGALNIVHVVVTENFAGTERYVCDVSTELARRGHRVAVIGGSPTVMPGLVPGDWRPAAGLGDAIRAVAARGRVDIVHTHITKADFAAFLATPRNRARRVSTRHILASRGYTKAAQAFGAVVRRTLACEIAISEFVGSNVRVPPDVVLANGVASVDDSPVNRERVVLVAQRLEAEKDLETALAGWSLSGLADLGWRLEVAGHGPDRQSLEKRAEALGVGDSVRFLGWVPDIPTRMRTASIFLAPAPAEPAGLSVLEAMARALPVVASGSAGHLETVGLDERPALFEPGDAAGCAAALRQLAGDPAAAAEYGCRLQQLQRQRFTIAAHVDGLEQIYRSALATR